MDSWQKGLEIAHLIVDAGALTVLYRAIIKWNTVQDRLDMLYKEYCDEHGISFRGLKNDWEEKR